VRRLLALLFRRRDPQAELRAKLIAVAVLKTTHRESALA
jgi:hypothetical protein